MNKFAIFTVLALAAVAISVYSTPLPKDEDEAQSSPVEQDVFFDAVEGEEMSQSYLKTTDDEETQGLEAAGLEVFADFCIQSRDYILSDIKKETNNLSRGVFTLFFQTAEAVAKEAIAKQIDATEKLGDQLADPSKEISDDEDEIVAAGQREIQSSNTLSGFFTAFKANVAAVSATVGKMVAEKFDYMVQQFNIMKLAEGVGMACVRVAEYEKDLEHQFALYKVEGLTDEARQQYQSLELKDVPCATATKIIRLEGMCTLVRRGQEPFRKMIGH